MTLDEQIAWLGETSARSISWSNELADNEYQGDAKRNAVETAATLLTIENTLRAMRDERV